MIKNSQTIKLNLCKNCQKTIPNGLSFCSEHCQKVYAGRLGGLKQKGKTKEKTCTFCGRTFLVSVSSSNNTSRCPDCINLIPLTKCEICGKEFNYDWRKDSRIRKTPLRFCSPHCSRKFSSLQTKGTKTIICPDCNKPFETYIKVAEGTTRCPECRKQRLKEKSRIYRKKSSIKNKRKNSYKIKEFLFSENTFEGIIERHYLPIKSPNLYKLGFNLNISINQIPEELQKLKERLYKWYIVEELSCKEIEEITKVKRGTIKLFLQKLNIPTRTASEASALSIKKKRKLIFIKDNNIYHYKNEWHTTWDNKKYFLRSTYEIRFANLLDKYKIKYGVEEKYFTYLSSQTQKTKGAIPDFFLPKYNYIIETKGEHLYDEIDLKDRKSVIEESPYTFIVLRLEEIKLLEECKTKKEFFKNLLNYKF